MRTITKDYLEKQKKQENPLSYILNTPRPDFSQMHKENIEFEKEMIQAQAEDRKMIMDAIHE